MAEPTWLTRGRFREPTLVKVKWTLRIPPSDLHA